MPGNTNQRWRQAALVAALMQVTRAFSPAFLPKTASARSSRLQALIFDESGSSVDGHSSSTFQDSDNDNSDIISLLSETSSAALARLACAFAPEGHEIHPSDLMSAHVVSVDNDRIEISAAVCETGGCVTLFVPVDFPRYCSLAELEACVIENVQELDDTAMERIQQQEYNHNNREELEAAEESFVKLQSAEPDDEMPLWWISAEEHHGSYNLSNNLMIEECQNMKSLLNEAEFRGDLKTVATKACVEAYPLDSFFLNQAAVSSIGPAGLIVKAHVSFGAGEDSHVVSLPVAFPSTANSSEDLRSYVLGVVEAV